MIAEIGGGKMLAIGPRFTLDSHIITAAVVDIEATRGTDDRERAAEAEAVQHDVQVRDALVREADGRRDILDLAGAEGVAHAGRLATATEVEGQHVHASLQVVALQGHQAVGAIGAGAVHVVDQHDGGTGARRLHEPAQQLRAVGRPELHFLVPKAEVCRRPLDAPPPGTSERIGKVDGHRDVGSQQHDDGCSEEPGHAGASSVRVPPSAGSRGKVPRR